MNDQFNWMLFRDRCSQAFSFKYLGCDALALNFNYFMEGLNETGSAISIQSGDYEIRILVKHCTNDGFPKVALRNTCYHPFESAKLVENTDEAWLRFLSQCVAFAWKLFEIADIKN